MEHDDASFGRWLTSRRQSLRLQRTELAARIGCAVITLRKIEEDERRPSRQVAELLAPQLAIPAAERETFVRVARGELPVARLARPGFAPARSHTLPPATTELVGRAQELDELAAILARPEVRLLTLTGAPGVGKSRLAHELAVRLQDRFADGAALVDLGALSDPELVLPTIAQALPTPVGQGLQRGEQLLDASLARCQASGDAMGLAWSLYALGDLRLVQGDTSRALVALEEALVHLRQQGMHFGVVRALFDMGLAHLEQGEIGAAAARYEAGLALMREAPPLTLLATGLEGLAAVLVGRGQALPAARLLGAAETLRESTDVRRGQLDQRLYERTLALAKAPCTAEDWAASWNAGRALTPAQAVAEALEAPTLA